MQTAGNLITAVTEFTTGMQDRHNYFYSRFADLMHFYRNTTAIITHSNTVIAVDSYIDRIAITCQSFVYTVINCFIYQMMQATGRNTADIHTRSFTYSFQTLQDLDLPGTILSLNLSCFFQIRHSNLHIPIIQVSSLLIFSNQKLL